MVHCQNPIILPVLCCSKEAVSGKRAEYQLALVAHVRYHGLDDFLIFLSDEAAIAGVWIETQYGDPGLPDAKVLFQRLFQESYLSFQPFLCDEGCYIPDRLMVGHQSYAEGFTHH